MTTSMWLFRFALPEGQKLAWPQVERYVPWALEVFFFEGLIGKEIASGTEVIEVKKVNST